MATARREFDQWHPWRIDVEGALASPACAVEAGKVTVDGRIDLTGMLTHTFRLDEWRAAFRTLISVHVGLNSLALLQWGTDEQREEWLPRLASGDLGCYALHTHRALARLRSRFDLP